jgi:hypothetical protein
MQNNYNNQDQNIDLSNALDSAVENKKQMIYAESFQQKPSNKKKIYLIIIIVSWIIIFSFAIYNTNKKQKINDQREQIRQEIESRIKQGANTK